jgi:CheY-like chemotaxis protein
LRREPVDLATVVRNAIDTSRPLIEAGRHELTVEIGTGPLTVMADPVRLAQVVANLLNNAAKYTEEGGCIAVRAARDGACAVVSVRDNGVGIPADMLAHVFDLFAQANRTYQRAQGGLGIGLTLVRSLVELHGGSVVAKSDGPGRGSEFIVRLPLGLALARGDEPPRAEGVGELGAHRILVVDDSADAAESLAILLRHLGADVQIAGDGEAALAVLESYRPSVVLLDIGMPGMDGFEVARRARQRQSGRDATLIALSGWGQDEDRRRSEEAGIEYHFVKPVDVEALTRLLTALSRSERVHGAEADGASARPH